MVKMNKSREVNHPYFYPKTIPSYELLTREELGWVGDDGNTTFPLSVGERDGEVWTLSFAGSRLYLSRDNRQSFKKILDSGLVGSFSFAMVTNNLNENQAIIIVGDDNKVYQSTDLTSDTPTSWQEVQGAPSSGYFTSNYGWDIHDRFILLGTYGVKNESNPPRHIYFSRDYGSTFEEIEVYPISEMGDPAHFHIHDVCFDPYANRIWVATGDQGNSNIHYSDDWGKSFNKVYEHESRTTQPTGIFAMPDRVIFTSDDRPDGVKVWERPQHERKAEVRQEDIYLTYTPIDFSVDEGLRSVANLPQTTFGKMLEQYPYNVVLPFSPTGGTQGTTPAQLIATPNGVDYFVLWSSDKRSIDEIKTSITYLLPVMPSDEEGYIYCLLYYSDLSTSLILKMKLPEWVKVQ